MFTLDCICTGLTLEQDGWSCVIKTNLLRIDKTELRSRGQQHDTRHINATVKLPAPKETENESIRADGTQQWFPCNLPNK